MHYLKNLNCSEYCRDRIRNGFTSSQGSVMASVEWWENGLPVLVSVNWVDPAPDPQQWHTPRLTSWLEAYLFSPNSLVLCSFGSTILGRTTHEWREKLLCVARVHGRNIRHACSTGDTFGGPRYHLDKSAKAPNQRLSPFARNHNLPAILCACGSSTPKFFKRFLFF